MPRPRSFSISSTKATVGTISAHDKDFETHLNNNNIYLARYRDADEALAPSNLDELLEMLARSRSSLSPGPTPLSYDQFRQAVKEADSELEIMRNVVPLICGNPDPVIHSGQYTLFTELEPISSGDVAEPNPRFFDGASLRDAHLSLRGKISQHCIPKTDPRIPIVPNFFLEAKGRHGSSAVLQRQACYDGAYGARAMHSLQNYGNQDTDLVFDNKAYTYSATYYDGALRLYAHHITRPADSSSRPGYHMTHLGGYDLTGNEEYFVKGVNALRNVRDRARQCRDDFLKRANLVASELDRQDDSNSASDGVVDDDGETLQRHIADMNREDSEILQGQEFPHTEASQVANRRSSFTSEPARISKGGPKRRRITSSPSASASYRSRLRRRAD